MATRNFLGIAFDFCDSKTKGAGKFGAYSLSRYLMSETLDGFTLPPPFSISPVALLVGLNWSCALWGW